MTDFAQTLKRVRAAAGLSQQGMADRMLIPKRTIEKWETGERTPPPYVQRFVLNELEALRKKAHTEEIVSSIIDRLQSAKTEEDLEEVNELADDAVAAGWLTQREVDALWDDFAPDLTD